MLQRMTGPGLFRLFLALLVFMYHITPFAVGPCAVYIFFCLSGYWIHRMYTGRYSATRRPYLTYLVSRAWRLLPTFWLITLVTLSYIYFGQLLQIHYKAVLSAHFVAANILIIGYYTLHLKPIVPAWSLDIEMQYYLIAPLIALLLTRVKMRARWTVLAAVAISAAAAYWGCPIPVCYYLVFFVIGAGAASGNWRPSGRFALALLAACALLIACCLASPWRGLLLAGSHPGPLAIYVQQTNVAIAVFAIPYAIYTTRQKESEADAMFGDLSYIVYLLHWVGVLWLTNHPGGWLHKSVYASVAVFAVAGFSFLIWKYFDRPVNRLRSRWVRARIVAAAATGARPAHRPATGDTVS